MTKNKFGVTKAELEEIAKSNQSPYYFATNFLFVNGKPFTTMYTQEEFDKKFFDCFKIKRKQKG